MAAPDETPSAPREKPSTIPSWVMLGFLLGILFMWLLPKPEPPSKAQVPEGPREAANTPVVPRLTAIEAVFAGEGHPVLWENDLTEVALWNPEAQAYTDFFEVLRTDKGYYFRSLSRLTRPAMNRGVKPDSLLLFTESEAQRQEWLKQVAEENARTLSRTTRQILGPGQKPPASSPANAPELPPPARQIAPGDR